MYCSDCIDYAPGGKCRNPKVHKRLVGFFQAPCREFNDKQKTQEMETTPTTKVCKVCGQEKPLDEFQRSRFGGRIATCKECMGKKIAAVRTPASVPDESTPTESIVPLNEVSSYEKAIALNNDPTGIAYFLPLLPDEVLAAELRRRGYTGTLTKAQTLTI